MHPVFLSHFLDVSSYSDRQGRDRSHKELLVPKDNILPLRPDTFVAAVDVNVSLPLINASVWLNFGPFDSRDDAEDWLNILQIVHLEIEEPNTHHLYMANSFMIEPDDEPDVACFIGSTDTPQVDASFRVKGELIPSGSAADTAEQLGKYALAALAQAISDAQMSLS